MTNEELFAKLERDLRVDPKKFKSQGRHDPMTPIKSEHSPEELLRQVQDGMKGIKGIKIARKAIRTIVEREHWRELKDGNCQNFASFAEFAVAPEPHGLEAWGNESGKDLKELLINQNQHGAWLLYLRQEKRGPGRPPKNTTDSVGSHDIYEPTPGPDSIDYRLTKLDKKNPEIAQRLIDRQITFKQAEVLAGFKVNTPLRSRSMFRSDGSVNRDLIQQMDDSQIYKFVRESVMALPIEKGFKLVSDLRSDLGEQRKRAS